MYTEQQERRAGLQAINPIIISECDFLSFFFAHPFICVLFVKYGRRFIPVWRGSVSAPCFFVVVIIGLHYILYRLLSFVSIFSFILFFWFHWKCWWQMAWCLSRKVHPYLRAGILALFSSGRGGVLLFTMAMLTASNMHARRIETGWHLLFASIVMMRNNPPHNIQGGQKSMFIQNVTN